ncbi:IS5/IS1182 family transposase [Burkholderia ubonensis]|uniref:IS5/IS1182 family transposase n=1 Tax=Burkholderia ubonensis TaxID=101571 RepID=UPI000756AD18|nr:IS5/IS1182 family transposase [Burkholderia ubonensis]KVR00633.1 hypothetical protein WK10_12330 [Burkholderia ubonensis]KVZ42366.1 hypothetical protein WL17_09215 [Burkholderia ubonensis]
MGPKTPMPEGDFFRQPLREQINLKHPLVRLADLIDWNRLSAAMSASFVSNRGRPATSPRLIAGLLYLQHAFDLSDEEVVWQWLENPYWQVFTGETYLQTRPPIDPSSLTRWRKRLGEAGVDELLAETIEAANGQRSSRARGLRAMIRRRSAIEPAIGHMKADGKLDRNWLKGALGDAIHAVLCGAGHNLRMILRKLRLFCVFLLNRETAALSAARRRCKSSELFRADSRAIFRDTVDFCLL